MNEMQCCRCCLEFKKANTQFLISSQYGEGTILDLIKSVTNIEILDDEFDLPQQICSSCYTKFLTAEEIRNKFFESDKILREWSLTKIEELEDSQEATEGLEIEVIQNEDMDPPDAGSSNIYLIEEPILDTSITSTYSTKTTECENEKRSKQPIGLLCELCLIKVANKKLLTAHFKEHEINNDKPLIQCFNCSGKFYRACDYMNHECRRETLCYYCMQELTSEKAILEHIDMTHRSSPELLECKVEDCEFTCRSSHRMFHHLTSHYNPLNLTCSHCTKIFNDYLKYKFHIRNHFVKTEVTCDHCGKVFTFKTHLLRHFRSTHLKKRFNCEKLGCSLSFSTITNLVEHEMNAHGRESSIQCRKCGQKFAYPSNLRYHEKMYPHCSQRKLNSTKKPNLECQHCGKVFNHYSSKHRHVQTVHLKKRKFVCEYEGCNSSFGQKGHLLVHHRQHTGQKDYCSFCDFKCSTPSNMQKHIRNIHKILE